MNMTNQEVVSVYEAMVGLTAQMLDAANCSDWDRLVVLEQQCAAHVRTLKDNESPQPLAGESRARKVEAIRRMLDDDRKIRDLTMPWMAQLSALMSNAGAERRLARAYSV
jgi:flagellar protein FliT